MTRNFPAGDIRVSDAERDEALGELSEHFQTGRLTQDEFEERSGLALRAKTGNDLNELFTDLPAGPAHEPTAHGAVSTNGDEEQGTSDEGVEKRDADLSPAGGRRGSTARIVIACVIAFTVIGNLAHAANQGAQHVSVGWIVPVIMLLVILRRIGR